MVDDKKILLEKKESKQLKEFRKQERLKKQKEELSRLREKFGQSRTEKINRLVRLAIMRRRQQINFARQFQRSGQQGYAYPQQYAQQLARQKLLQNSVGWEAHFVAPQLEKEISGFNGVANEGNIVASRIGQEVGMHGNLQHINPTLAVSREAQMHSRLVDIFPSITIDRQALFFGNILP